jgi:hypothetical protein
MPFDEHESNLRKLERAAAQAKSAQDGLAGGILTQMNNGGGQQQEQQQGYGGGRGGGGGNVSRMAPIQDEEESNRGGGQKSYDNNSGNSGPAPGVSGQLQQRAIKASKRDVGSDDEFADADIDDLWAD